MTSREKQGGFSNWQELRDHAIELFQETPHPTTEQEIIDAYEAHPTAIAKAIEAVAASVQAGTARSGWAVLRTRAATIKAAPSNPARSSSIDREKAIARAEQWIRSTGCHFDRQTEILLELFDSSGLLHDYAQIESTETGRNDEGRPIYGLSDPTGDLALVERMIKAWDEARPAGITIEQDAEARAAKYRDHQAQLAALEAQVQAAREPEPELVPLGATRDPDDDLPL